MDFHGEVKSKMVGLIVARSKNNVIGKHGEIPWKIKGEQKQFRQLTTGNVVVMGRKSYEEIGHPLPNRKNIVVSNSMNYFGENLITVASLDEALDTVDNENIYIAGGYGLFKEALPLIDIMYITEIDMIVENGDVFFPEFDQNDFDICVGETGGDDIKFTRTIYKRKKFKIQLEKISNKYNVRRLDGSDVNTVLELCSKNTLYYQYCPPLITKEGVIQDMEVLPPGKTKSDKYYLGYFENDVLIAVLDLITGYPNESTAYIGLFMLDIKVQGQGIGTKIIEELCEYLKNTGFQRVELAWVKGNLQSEKFWIKNNFNDIGERSSNAAEHVIVAERELS